MHKICITFSFIYLHGQSLAPRGCKQQAGIFLGFSRHYSEREAPDPYYGGAQGFGYVLDTVVDAVQGLLQHIRQNEV